MYSLVSVDGASCSQNAVYTSLVVSLSFLRSECFVLSAKLLRFSINHAHSESPNSDDSSSIVIRSEFGARVINTEYTYRNILGPVYSWFDCMTLRMLVESLS